MKRFHHLLTRYLIHCLCGLGLLLVGSTTPVLADSPDTKALYDTALEAEEDEDYFTAAIYLKVFTELGTDDAMLQNPDFAAEVLERQEEIERRAKDLIEKGENCGPLVSSRNFTRPTMPSLPPYPAFSTPPSKSLVCRSRGEMSFEYRSTSDLSLKPQLWITFEKGPWGVGQSWEYIDDLEPGQCAWLDGRVDEYEPNQIVMLESILGSSDFSISWQGGRVRGVNSSPAIIALQFADEVQIFDVYDDGQGHFIVTGLGTGAPQQPSPGPSDLVHFAPSDSTSSDSSPSGETPIIVDDDGCLIWDLAT
jgi:hypothetical protein